MKKNYLQIGVEQLASKYGIKKNSIYLLGIPFLGVTDHKPLVSMYENEYKIGSARKTQGYDFRLEYGPGTDILPTIHQDIQALQLKILQRQLQIVLT